MGLIPPGTVYGERLTQVDFRMAKMFDFGGGRRMQGIVDVYSVLNVAAVITHNNTYGTAWLRPTQILQARLLKFGFQFEF